MIVISYDIVDDLRRNKVAKTLLDYSIRVQYSVFEVDDTEKLDEISRKLTGLINKDEDNIKYYQLCQNCQRKNKVTGKEKSIANIDKKYIII